jgi:hypothetical protein
VTINVDEKDSDLPYGSILSTDNDPTIVYIPAGGGHREDFGFELLPATVTGLVWWDNDGDGEPDPTRYEPGLPNISVIITDDQGSSQTLETDTKGRYAATVVPGQVTIDVNENDPDLPYGSILSTDNDPTIVYISAGGSHREDFGFELLPATVTGLVWWDDDGDGERDPTGYEPGLPNISVIITDGQGSSQTLETDVGGRYAATVVPGKVTINVDEKDSDLYGSILSTDNDPTVVYIPAGGSHRENFGFEPLPEP